MIDKYLFCFFIVWYICGVILLTFQLLPDWLEWANIVFLITSGLLGIAFFIRSSSLKKGLIAVGVIFLLSMVIESVGVKTGLFFGDYIYETSFGPKIAEVPITIGFAWVMVIATSHVLAAPVAEKLPRLKAISYAAYGAFVATALDLIIDPVAFVVKEYWIWLESGIYYGIPASNFYGWFILSFCLHLFLYAFFHKGKKWTNNKNVYWRKNMILLYGLMTGMFVVIALVNQLIVASILSIFALSIIYLLYKILGERRTITHDQSKDQQSTI